MGTCQCVNKKNACKNYSSNVQEQKETIKKSEKNQQKIQATLNELVDSPQDGALKNSQERSLSPSSKPSVNQRLKIFIEVENTYTEKSIFFIDSQTTLDNVRKQCELSQSLKFIIILSKSFRPLPIELFSEKKIKLKNIVLSEPSKFYKIKMKKIPKVQDIDPNWKKYVQTAQEQQLKQSSLQFLAKSNSNTIFILSRNGSQSVLYLDQTLSLKALRTVLEMDPYEGFFLKKTRGEDVQISMKSEQNINIREVKMKEVFGRLHRITVKLKIPAWQWEQIHRKVKYYSNPDDQIF